MEESSDIENKINEFFALDAKNKANKIIKKNYREIQRLKKHAENAIYDNDFYAYKYAIEKLRTFYKQKFNDELIHTMWITSRKTIWDIINDSTN